MLRQTFPFRAAIWTIAAVATTALGMGVLPRSAAAQTPQFSAQEVEQGAAQAQSAICKLRSLLTHVPFLGSLLPSGPTPPEPLVTNPETIENPYDRARPTEPAQAADDGPIIKSVEDEPF